jgi:hypothetical protein
MKGWIYVHTPADYAKWAGDNLRAEASPAPAEPRADDKKVEKKAEPKKEGKAKK